MLDVQNETKTEKALTKWQNDIKVNEEKKYWREITVPFTLREGLAKLTKDELVSIRQFYDMKNVSQLKKAALAQLLEERIPQLLVEIVKIIDEKQFDILIDLARREQMPASRLSDSQIKFWRNAGILFTGTVDGERMIAIPQDLQPTILALEADTELRIVRKRNTEWIRLTNGLLYYYGTLQFGTLVDKLMQLTNKTTVTFELKDYIRVLHCAERLQGECYANDHGYSHRDVQNPSWVLAEQKKRKDVLYYPFTKEELLKAGEAGFIEQNRAYKKLIQLLVKQNQVEPETAEQAAEEVVIDIKNGKSTNEIIRNFSAQIVFESREDVEPVMQQLLEVMNTTRQWILKGHTPQELAAQERSQLRPLDNTTENKPIRKEKIGRNEPCPCGSGKKYKKCHGR